MLTIDILRQNPKLSGLTDEQLTAISTMSQNDENNVIGTRIGEIHGQYENDILTITGIQKNQGEKAYDYNKRILTEYKAKIDGNADAASKLAAANTKIQELQAKIDAGEGDAVVRQQLKDTKQQLAALTAQVEQERANFATERQNYEARILNGHVESAFASALANIKFKSAITDGLRGAIIAQAKTEVLAKGTPELNEQGVVIMRDANQNILTNPKNNMQPYTLGELILETSLKDAIDAGQRQTGGGTGSGNGGNGGGTSIDMTAARNQVEADEMIAKHLMGQGLTSDSREYQDKFIELRKENNVAALPMR